MPTVCVTGASGFIASHIVAQLLEKGWQVRATVRDPTNLKKVAHLKALPNADTNLELVKADLTVASDFITPIKGCDAVIHTATPVIFGAKDGKASIYDPALAGTKAVLDAIVAAGTVKTMILTSSTSAMAPVPEPVLKSEVHWSDSELQKSKSNWYGACKTDQEKMCIDFVAKLEPAKTFRFVAICPTFVIGPLLSPEPAATMQHFIRVLKGQAFTKCNNDSMSFIDVRDVAGLHVAALTTESARGRYMGVARSEHWNDLVPMLSEAYPEMVSIAPFSGEDLVVATKFDRSRQDSLLIVRDLPEIFKDAVADLKSKNLL
eukprot:m.23176 g.23176  ORF g.23176 m.23176 type:complete len:319 (+) comp14101_c0_seq1:71-1027(+)